jgi:hypothetical protein
VPNAPAGADLVAAVRPEDVVLSADGNGVPATIEHVIDLGHYRRVSVRAGETPLLVFAPKSEPLPGDSLRARATRLLVYADDRLLSVVEPDPGGAREGLAEAAPPL